MTQFPHRDSRYRFKLAQGLVIEDCRRYTEKSVQCGQSTGKHDRQQLR
jgi:hypothetical protein